MISAERLNKLLKDQDRRATLRANLVEIKRLQAEQFIEKVVMPKFKAARQGLLCGNADISRNDTPEKTEIVLGWENNYPNCQDPKQSRLTFEAEKNTERYRLYPAKGLFSVEINPKCPRREEDLEVIIEAFIANGFCVLPPSKICS